MSDEGSSQARSKQPIKCLIWDLDNTIWDGILAEDKTVSVRSQVVEVIKTLDQRGILHSLASKNDQHAAIGALQRVGLADFFLYPQVGWSSKSQSIRKIATSMRLGLDAMALVDDDPYEREEVAFSLPEVRCLTPDDIETMLELPELTPAVRTTEAMNRRQFYLDEIHRQQAKAEFEGPPSAFMETLDARITIKPAAEQDLIRAEELTVRTHQLNSTGYTYSTAQLQHFLQSDRHKIFVAMFDDKFGSYGQIGLMLLDTTPQTWTIKLVVVSCRVLSRGIGGLLLQYLINKAAEHQVGLRAEFVPSSTNRVMQISFGFAGFRPVARLGNTILYEHPLSTITPYPRHMVVCEPEDNPEKSGLNESAPSKSVR